MIDIPVEDLVFVVCTLVGGGLLLITVLVDDIIGAFIDFDIGGVSLMPLLLSFISMFGVGGLFATQVLDVHGGQAAIAGTGFGVVGMGVAYILFGLLRRAEAAEPFSTHDLVGDQAFVAGSYNSALFKNALVLFPPPVTRTLPFGSSVAVWFSRAIFMAPFVDHIPEDGSNSSVASVTSAPPL